MLSEYLYKANLGLLQVLNSSVRLPVKLYPNIIVHNISEHLSDYNGCISTSSYTSSLSSPYLYASLMNEHLPVEQLS